MYGAGEIWNDRKGVTVTPTVTPTDGRQTGITANEHTES